MTTRPTNFLEYLASQEQNMLVSMQKFRQEFDLFGALDRLYQVVLAKFLAPNNGLTADDIVVAQLFVFGHNHFYLGMSLLLRTHVSDGYHSVRTAIDAALIAYRIILKDGSPEDYVNRANEFTAVPRYIRRRRKSDTTAYPLAEPLLKLHELCSQFASHADFSVFLHRLRIEKNGQQQLINVGYFQHDQSTTMHQMLLMTFLDAHLCVMGIYESFFIEKGLVAQEWISDRREIGSAVTSAKAQLRQALDEVNAQETSEANSSSFNSE